MNKVILIGRISIDPEKKFTQSGKAVARYSLAVDRPSAKEGTQNVDFIPCITWGKSADFAEKYLTKGLKIAVEGRLQFRSYTDKDGNKRTAAEVVVDKHEFCESKSKGNTASGNNENHYTPASTGASYGAFSELEDEDDGDLTF